MLNLQLLIDNVRTDASDGGRFGVTNPANGEKIATVARAGIKDVDRAVASAHKAFLSGLVRTHGGPAGGDDARRCRHHEKAGAGAGGVGDRANGKPITESLEIDIPLSIVQWRLLPTGHV